MIYAGVGSREAPDDILVVMENFARFAALRGDTLSTGAAYGADEAFMSGARSVHGSKATIYAPWDGYLTTARVLPYWYVSTSVCARSLLLASQVHPAWDRCSDKAKRLHARNGYVVLSLSLRTPVDFIVAWTQDGRLVGGTGQALRIAKTHDVPILNLGKFDAGQSEDRLMSFYEH